MRDGLKGISLGGVGASIASGRSKWRGFRKWSLLGV